MTPTMSALRNVSMAEVLAWLCTGQAAWLLLMVSILLPAIAIRLMRLSLAAEDDETPAAQTLESEAAGDLLVAAA